MCESLCPSNDSFAAVASALLTPNNIGADTTHGVHPYPGTFPANPREMRVCQSLYRVNRLQQLTPRVRGSRGYPHELLQQAEGKPSKSSQILGHSLCPAPHSLLCVVGPELIIVTSQSGNPWRSHLPLTIGIVAGLSHSTTIIVMGEVTITLP